MYFPRVLARFRGSERLWGRVARRLEPPSGASKFLTRYEQPDLFSTKKAVSDFGAIFAVFSWFLSFILLFEALFYGNRALI